MNQRIFLKAYFGAAAITGFAIQSRHIYNETKSFNKQSVNIDSLARAAVGGIILGIPSGIMFGIIVPIVSPCVFIVAIMEESIRE